uniref:Probable glutathione S-transferase n=1 Tax=Davidia involucrata TaxID=16924 RepID=A0A5B7B5S7_DAVIN
MAEEGQEVKLLGSWYSPFVFRVRWALKLKGIQYEYIEQDLNNKSSLLLHYNPINKKVPVMIHGGKPIAESLVIIEYMDETWKHNPILPVDPYQKAMARFWAKFIEEKFTVARTLILDGEQQKKEVKQARDVLEILEGELKGKRFFGGDTIGFLDIVLGRIPGWLGAIEEVACIKVFDPIEYPRMKKWMDSFSELPMIKESLPPRNNLVQHFHKFRQHGRDPTTRTGFHY